MSGKRNLVFANDEFYHCFNRSTAGEEIFVKKRDINHALDLLSFYRYQQTLRFSFFERLKEDVKKNYLYELKEKSPIVDIFAYAFMPNHFHILIRQNEENGIQTFLSNMQNGFAKYYKIRNKRFGALFQRPFKAKHVSTDEELLHLSRYIHLNPVTSYLTDFEHLKTSAITSLPYYMNNNDDDWVSKEFVLALIKTSGKYIKFLEDQIDYQRKLNKIRHLIIEK